QDLGGCGLLLQSFARLCDETGVLHRDDRLCREALHQRDLVLSERPDLSAIKRENAPQHIVLSQGDIEDRAGAAQVSRRSISRPFTQVLLARSTTCWGRAPRDIQIDGLRANPWRMKSSSRRGTPRAAVARTRPPS